MPEREYPKGRTLCGHNENQESPLPAFSQASQAVSGSSGAIIPRHTLTIPAVLMNAADSDLGGADGAGPNDLFGDAVSEPVGLGERLDAE